MTRTHPLNGSVDHLASVCLGRGRPANVQETLGEHVQLTYLGIDKHKNELEKVNRSKKKDRHSSWFRPHTAHPDGT